MSSDYNFSLTTFSPSGKLIQIEYALNAVSQGVSSVGIKAENGVVLVTEKKATSSLVDVNSLEKISLICPTIGMVYSGMGPDARVLLAAARKSAQNYRLTYGEYPNIEVLVRSVADTMQEFTQSGGVRPFGVSLLIAGADRDGSPALYQVDPSGAFWPWRAAACGKNANFVRNFLERRYTEDDHDIHDAVHTALLALKESAEGGMKSCNIEIGIWTAGKFKKLTISEIEDYLGNL